MGYLKINSNLLEVLDFLWKGIMTPKDHMWGMAPVCHLKRKKFSEGFTHKKRNTLKLFKKQLKI